jgi:hypothetical protein
MPKKTTTPEYVTREILKEEISASEKRLEVKIVDVDKKVDGVEKRLDEKIDSRFNQLAAKIETTAQSLKDYTDSRFNQFDARLGDVDSKVNGLDTKLTKYFELMMQMFTEANKGIHKILSSHEERITVLEGRGAQPGRI